MNGAELDAVVDRIRPADEPPARGAPGEAAQPIDGAPIAWERLWLATQRRPWGSLAVVPVGEGVATVRIARALAGVGACHLGHAVEVTDATSITLGQLRARAEAWSEPRGRAERVIIALGSVLASPASLALAQTADAAILCVTLGKSSIDEARRTIEEIGEARFLGSVCLRPGGEQR